MTTMIRRRLPAIDAARGAAVVAMIAYHLCWDLTHFGLAAFDLFTAPLWLAARTGIVSAFLFLAGVSLALAARDGLDRRRFARRWAVLVAAAAGISAVSLALFPDSPILFGVLHHLAVGSVLGLAFMRLPAVVPAVLGLAVCVLPEIVTVPLFDSPWLHWIGLMTHDPSANDYVPLFPWFGVMLLGIAAGRAWGGGGALGGALATWAAAGRSGRGLVWLGRHSLAVYLIHQPLLFGTLWALTSLGTVAADDTRGFHASCVSTCRGNGTAAETCEESCRCVAHGLKSAGVWERTLGSSRLDGEAVATVTAIVRACRGGSLPSP